MSWRVHPALENRRKLILACVIIIPVIIWLWIYAGSFWAVLGMVVIFISLMSFFLPTEYYIEEDEIRIKKLIMTQNRPIDEFKKVYILENGVLFSPFRKRTFLNNFRGVFLLFPEDRENVVSYIESRFANLISNAEDDKS